MSKTRQWVVSAAVAIVLILAAGWFLLVSPQRAKAADLRHQEATEQAAAQALRTDLAVLTAQEKRLPIKLAQLAKFSRQIPKDAALPSMVRSLQQAATSAGVSLVSIAPAVPAPYAGAAGVSNGLPASGPGGAPTSTSGLQVVSVQLKATGTYVQLEQFVANLEGTTRVFVVTLYSMSPSTTDSTTACTPKVCEIELDLTGQVFTAQPTVAPPVAAAAPAAAQTAK
ncbi:MAG: hypothetical protein WCB04_13965 [Mycobacteriales bacterium]